MLSAQNIQKSYRQLSNQLHVLKGINLNVREGDVLSIIGPSGAGKSTLLHILGGLDKPDAGTVILDGEEIYALSEKKRAGIRNTKVGFIFQFYHLLSEFSALENVCLPAMVREDRNNTKPFKDRAVDLLTRVGLQDRVEHKPNELSGGEQQRVAIARALMNEPKIIFCDEPTGNLDSENGRAIMELLLELNRERKQTFVIVTHDENIAKKSHQAVTMKDGHFI